MVKRSDELRDMLEEEILTGQWRPGDRLEEVMLAERYGVSRTPIREALLQLSASGLIENRPRRGAVVAEIGPRKLMEMFDVMAELEAMCARLAARRVTDESLRRISEAHEACGRAFNSADTDAYYYENEVFHAMIRQAGRNEFLIEQAETLQKRLKPYRRMQLRARDRIRASYQEHEMIAAAIARGDAVAAAEAMRGHVGGMGERFNDLLASLDAAARNVS
ncbi:GntR family transcriptional regulator [Tabrizicola piscis]|uniref:GntR family transcriptional regulator n=1 Tax=Tabrizicola piscis TaxID=2494374 RepID=A0A3S8U911_9RHOB|nr:GntR family transcriptional regulator [Tabrizicola piscis]AZL60020.1 GntR family transcriptional regulator [Tabrizicola piscis]